MIEVGIISHERAERLARETLPTLHRLGVADDQVTVFVVPDQISWYQLALPRGIRIVPGEQGICANRNVLVQHYPSGTRVVSVDDDVRDMLVMEDGKWRSQTMTEFRVMVAQGFRLLETFNGGLWGLSPIQNDLWARRLPELHVGMPKVDGPFWGFVAGRAELTIPVESRFEDVERGCVCVESGYNLVRMNRFTYKISLSTRGGSTVAYRKNACADAWRIQRLYPRLVQHGKGYYNHESACLPKPRRGRFLASPRAPHEVDDMWGRVNAGPAPLVEEEIHD